MSDLDTQQLADQADDLLSRGKLNEALSIYQTICTRENGNSDAWMMRGAIGAELGLLGDAVTHLKKAIELDDSNVSAHYSLAGVLRAQGDIDAAVAYLQRALGNDPEFADAWVMLAGIHGLRGEYTQALECCRRATALQSDSVDAHMNLGNSALQLGMPEDAAASYRVVVTLQPNIAMAWLQLGRAELQLNNLEQACSNLRQAVTLDPANIDALMALGYALRRQGVGDEAIACYRHALTLAPNLTDALCELGAALSDCGHAGEAMACFERAITLAPTSPVAHAGLGTVLQTQGKHAAAIEAFRRALQQSPESAGLYTNISTSYQRLGNLDEAEDCLRQALRIDPLLAEAHNNLGSVLNMAGCTEEAIVCTQQALTLKPDLSGAHDNYLMSLNYVTSKTPEEIFRAHESWGRVLEQQTVAFTGHTNTPDRDRTLRIAYVSPDLRAHAVSGFLESILAHHNAARFHVTCYAEVINPDDVTTRLRGLAHAWRFTCGLSDAQLAAQIRDDEIDILVDLAGHTAHNRLGVFAAKPAPLQISYLGYANTSGLTRIDHRITDVLVDPQGHQRYYTEKLLYLDGCFTCYAPSQDVPAVARLPALRNGYITFGSMANLCKVSDRTLDLWCTVLRAIPSARFLFYRHLLKGRARDRLHSAFESRGIACERVILIGEIPPEYQTLPFGKRFYGFFERIDVMLDTTPWNSHTTACECLWMGLPIITLLGDRHAGRICASVLTATGLTDLIASDEKEFLSIAEGLSHDIESLAQLRAGLRDRMRRSALCDGTTFTLGIEQAYRSAWEHWCESACRPYA